MTAGNPKDEYVDVSHNLRQFMTMRFAQLTVYLGLTGVLLNLVFTGNAKVSPYGSLVLQVGGLVITLIFWVHQERTMAYWNHFMRRAIELEADLGFQQYSTRPSTRGITSFKAMRLFFAIMTLFWVSSFFWIG